MSNKPKKRSDQDKAWNNRPRASGFRLYEPDYHLIITQGTDTEPLYFDALQKAINARSPGRIELRVESKPVAPSQLIGLAKAFIDQNAPLRYVDIWVVYDKDDFTDADFNKTQEMCDNLTKETGARWHALWSNQCFELWFLLHFCYYQTADGKMRRNLQDKLTEHLSELGSGNYKKDRADMFTILRPKLDDAIRHAKCLESLHMQKSPAQSEPCTKVYRLLEMLREYL